MDGLLAFNPMALLSDAKPGTQDIIQLSPLQVAAAAALILVQAAVSVQLSLGLQTQLFIAAVRCVVQLSCLGYILVPIFKSGLWWVVLLYAIFMTTVSAYEAVGRPSHYYKV